MKGRLHQETLLALLGDTAPRGDAKAAPNAASDDTQALLSPGVGWFIPAVNVGDVVAPDTVLGRLDTLGRTALIIAPAGFVGRIASLGQASGRFAVDYKKLLMRVAPIGDLQAAQASAGNQAGASGLVFRAPSSGRFYGRPSPDKASFVNVGDVVTQGQTLCLLEVMKTFHRVTYGGATLPPRARIKAVLVAEESDIGSGDALFALEESLT